MRFYVLLGKKEGSELYFNISDTVTDIEPIIKKVNPDVLINCIGILNKVADEQKLWPSL